MAEALDFEGHFFEEEVNAWGWWVSQVDTWQRRERREERREREESRREEGKILFTPGIYPSHEFCAWKGGAQ